MLATWVMVYSRRPSAPRWLANCSPGPWTSRWGVPAAAQALPARRRQPGVAAIPVHAGATAHAPGSGGGVQQITPASENRSFNTRRGAPGTQSHSGALSRSTARPRRSDCGHHTSCRYCCGLAGAEQPGERARRPRRRVEPAGPSGHPVSATGCRPDA